MCTFTSPSDGFVPSFLALDASLDQQDGLDQDGHNQISVLTPHQSYPERAPEQELEDDIQSDTEQRLWQEYKKKSRAVSWTCCL